MLGLHGNGKGAFHLKDGLLDQLAKRVGGMGFPKVVYQLGEYLCVRVRLELITTLRQKGLHIVVVSNNAVVYHDESVFLVRTMWVGVPFAWNSMGGPSSVRDANMGQNGFAVVASAEIYAKNKKKKVFL